MAIIAMLVATTASPGPGLAQGAERFALANGLRGRHLVGYQGWFGCDTDTAERRWPRWFSNNKSDAGHMTFDMWPDVSQLPAEATCPTPLTLPDGSPARLFSSRNPTVVHQHFRWMRDYEIDGAMVQRFVSGIRHSAGREARNLVLGNIRAASRKEGRAFAIMYDISGAPAGTWAEDLLADWRHLVQETGLLDEPGYWHENGRPVLAIWGFGFKDRPATPAQALALVERLRAQHADGPRPYLFLGIPAYWRSLARDQVADPAWHDVYRAADALSPWAVGRYGDDAGARAYTTTVLAEDLRFAAQEKKLLVPVVFPGYSFANAGKAPGQLNLIRRRCGRLYWTGMREAIKSGARTLYTAMFDEVDEATAIMPTIESSAQAPVGARIVTRDADGCRLPADWYLQLARAGSRALRQGDALPFDLLAEVNATPAGAVPRQPLPARP